MRMEHHISRSARSWEERSERPARRRSSGRASEATKHRDRYAPARRVAPLAAPRHPTPTRTLATLRLVANRRRDLWALALFAVAVRLPAVLSSRHLSFDDGVYGATAVALRHGARPYRDVFSS